MNAREAKWLMLRELVRWCRRPYHELRGQIDQEHTIEQRGASGTRYQLEISVFWDDRADGDIRVIVMIDDGGARAFCPMACDTLVRRPAPG